MHINILFLVFCFGTQKHCNRMSGRQFGLSYTKKKYRVFDLYERWNTSNISVIQSRSIFFLFLLLFQTRSERWLVSSEWKKQKEKNLVFANISVCILSGFQLKIMEQWIWCIWDKCSNFLPKFIGLNLSFFLLHRYGFIPEPYQYLLLPPLTV